MKVIFVYKSGERREFAASVGQSLLDVARENKVDEVEGACEGSLACSTCHLIIDPQWYAKLPVPKPDEQDMLDLAKGVTRNSRLGCQIRLTAGMDGLTVKLP